MINKSLHPRSLMLPSFFYPMGKATQESRQARWPIVRHKPRSRSLRSATAAKPNPMMSGSWPSNIHAACFEPIPFKGQRRSSSNYLQVENTESRFARVDKLCGANRSNPMAVQVERSSTGSQEKSSSRPSSLLRVPKRSRWIWSLRSPMTAKTHRHRTTPLNPHSGASIARTVCW